MAYNAEAGQRANAPGKESDAMNIDPRVDSTTPTAAPSSTPYTFEQHPPERGQMVQLDNKWHMVECHPLTRDITDEYHGGGPEIIDRQEYWSTGIREALEDGRKLALLLPSPRQCRAAGLNIPQALRGMPGAFYGNALSWQDAGWGGITEFHGQLAITTNGGTVITADCFDRAKLLIQRAESLQSWLAGWNEEAANGE